MILATTVTEWATLLGALGSCAGVLLNLKQTRRAVAKTEVVASKVDDVHQEVVNSNG